MIAAALVSADLFPAAAPGGGLARTNDPVVVTIFFVVFALVVLYLGWSFLRRRRK